MSNQAMLGRLESMLQAGKDSAMLRFSLGNEYLRAGQPERACRHLQAALEHDPAYSAAWKLLGKAATEAGDAAAAVAAYRQGIKVAEKRGDLQAAKEMVVFLRRLEKASQPGQGELS